MKSIHDAEFIKECQAAWDATYGAHFSLLVYQRAVAAEPLDEDFYDYAHKAAEEVAEAAIRAKTRAVLEANEKEQDT